MQTEYFTKVTYLNEILEINCKRNSKNYPKCKKRKSYGLTIRWSLIKLKNDRCDLWSSEFHSPLNVSETYPAKLAKNNGVKWPFIWTQFLNGGRILTNPISREISEDSFYLALRRQ